MFSLSPGNDFIISSSSVVNLFLLLSSQSIFPSVFDLAAIILDHFLGIVSPKPFFFEVERQHVHLFLGFLNAYE
jgi:hypothetical protein